MKIENQGQRDNKDYHKQKKIDSQVDSDWILLNQNFISVPAENDVLEFSSLVKVVSNSD